MQVLNQLTPFMLMFVVLYFLMIRPRVKRQEQEKNFIQNMKKGDKVITEGGVHGCIVKLTDGTCVIGTLPDRIMLKRSAISMELSAKLKAAENKDYKKA